MVRRTCVGLALGTCLVMAAMATTIIALSPPVQAANIVDEWASVKAEPAPTLKPVTVEPKTTALLIFDMVKQFCNPQGYAGCPRLIPTVKKLLTQARAKDVMVVYTSIPSIAKADIDKELAPIESEPFVQSFLNKFLNTDLEKILKDKGITTVILTGLAANGAIIVTSGEAALRGFKVIVPVDAMTAKTRYAEQFTTWQLANAPIISPKITLTTSDMIKF